MDKEIKHIKKLQVTKKLLENRYLSYILIPAILFTSGFTIGEVTSLPISEYKTTTRTINGETGREKFSSITYDEHPTEHVISILECGPWEQISKNYYSREVVSYDIDLEKVLNKDYRISYADLDEKTYEKYRYIEYGNSIPEGESTEYATIRIQETIQDKSVMRRSQKYVVPGSLAGIAVGLIIDAIIKYRRVLDRYEIYDYLEYIEKQLREAEYSKRI